MQDNQKQRKETETQEGSSYQGKDSRGRREARENKRFQG